MPRKPMPRRGVPGQRLPGQKGSNPMPREMGARARQKRANERVARAKIMGNGIRPVGAKPASQRAWWLKLPIFGNLLAILFPREGSRVIKRAAPVGPQAMGSIVMARMGNFRRRTEGLSRRDRVGIMKARTPKLTLVKGRQHKRGRIPGVPKH